MLHLSRNRVTFAGQIEDKALVSYVLLNSASPYNYVSDETLSIQMSATNIETLAADSKEFGTNMFSYVLVNNASTIHLIRQGNIGKGFQQLSWTSVIEGISLSNVQTLERESGTLFYLVAYSSTNNKQNVIIYHYLEDRVELHPLSSELTSIFNVKFLSPNRVIIAGSYNSFTFANSSSLVFTHKLGAIFEAANGTSFYGCEGLT